MWLDLSSSAIWVIEFLGSLMTHEKTSFLFQRISVAIQRFNAVIFSNSFCHTDDNTSSLPKYFCRVKFFITICLISSPLGTEYQRQFLKILIIHLSQITSRYRPAFWCDQEVSGFKACSSWHQQLC